MNSAKPNRLLFEWLGWITLAIGFSPVLLEWWAYAWAPDTRLFPLLVPFALIYWARSISKPMTPRPALGTVLIGIGLVLELFGILAETWTVARLGAPLGVIGMAIWLGRPSPRLLGLLFFAVPIPVFVVDLTTPQLESFYAKTAIIGLREGLGLDLTSSGPLIQSGDQILELTAPDSGLSTALILLAGIWTLGFVRDWSTRQSIFWGAAVVCAVPLLQVLAVAIACLLVVSGPAEWATAWLRWGFQLTLVTGALFLLRKWRLSPREVPNQPHSRVL
ncbi:exosortase/archaeosortase family protein [Myxococcota bacterium]|nr:exosortase/archaeosortase family protein [Myxococcota bacterium]